MHILRYREPGKRPGTTRWAIRGVKTVKEAVDWMSANKDKAFTPAFVESSRRNPHIVAILRATAQFTH